MTDEQRSAVAAYFGVYAGQEKGLARMFLRDVNHPFITQAYQTLSEVWVEVLSLTESAMTTHFDIPPGNIHLKNATYLF
jgi:hypothetical protein